jgi:nicotinamide-nucleotide amidase
VKRTILIIISFFLLSLSGICGNVGSNDLTSAGENEENQKKLNAEIIVIGDEILIGQIIDTNSSWIAGQLNMYGIEIYQITAVHDDPDQIMQALKRAEGKVDLVITTGGLGPTIDDITKPVLCSYFNTKLVLHEPTLENIQKLVEKRGMTMNSRNHDQAMVPEICKVLPNEVGTAPGIWIERSNTIFVSLPGVPHEMKHIMLNQVLPYLQRYDKINSIYHKTVLTQGLPESSLAMKLKGWESALPANIKLAYLPDPYSVRMRLSAMGQDKKELEHQVEIAIARLKEYIPDNIFGYDNETMAEVVGRLLMSKNNSLSVAEGCTGGFISHLITSAPGSAGYFKGGITTYPSQLSQKLPCLDLEIPENISEDPEAVVRAIALSVKRTFVADYSIATLGIPGAGTGDKEVAKGALLIAVAGPENVVIEKIVPGDNPERNIIRTSQTALQILRRMLIN